jgi:hypothetical protein
MSTSKVLSFRRSVNGVQVEQRFRDGYIDATAMCAAHERDVSDWLALDSTLRLVEALAYRCRIGIKTGISRFSARTRVSALYSSLVMVRRGSPDNGGGTWIHPKLAVHLAQWCNPEFALLVSDWIEEWFVTNKSPFGYSSDPNAEWLQWKQRYDIRLELKDVCGVDHGLFRY